MTYLSNIDLNYSRPLDVHRWSDHPEVNSFVDKIYSSLPALSGNKQIRKKHLKVLLLDLYVAWSTDPDLKIAVSRDNNAYKAKSRYNELHISKVMPDLVDVLEAQELAHKANGFFDPETNKGRVSRVWATEKLAEELKAAVHLRFGISNHEDRETVILRNENKQDVDYEDTNQTRAMRSLLKRYNDLLARTHIDIHYLDKPIIRFQSSKAAPLPVTQGDKFVRRVFNNGRWDQGGRFYGGWWQRCPSEERKHIYFDGTITQEVDFSGLHIVLLYAQKGIDYWATTLEDPYIIEWPEDTDPDIDQRDATKLLLLTAINANNEKQAFKGFRAQCEKGSPAKKLTNTVLEGVLTKLKEKHKPIADKIASGAGIDLMYIDSQITERLIAYFTEQGVPILTIHDSYVVPFAYDVILEREMKRVFYEVTKVKKVKLKHTTFSSEDYWFPEGWGSEKKKLLGKDVETSQRHKEDYAMFRGALNLSESPPWLATWSAIY